MEEEGEKETQLSINQWGKRIGEKEEDYSMALVVLCASFVEVVYISVYMYKHTCNGHQSRSI